nr:hypothetical protein [uncultured Kingella sp.]
MQDHKTKLNGLLAQAQLTRAELARIFQIAPRNISRWNTHGIPQYAIAYLQLKAENIKLQEQMQAYKVIIKAA